MAQAQKGLGRGLEALLGGFGEADASPSEVRLLPLRAAAAPAALYKRRP